VAVRDNNKPKRASKPATTLEGRENQLISKAMDLVEKKIENGTATSQELTHFLKLGTTREILEQQRLAQENELLRAKVDRLASDTRQEALYEEAIAAMRRYAGQEPIESEYED